MSGDPNPTGAAPRSASFMNRIVTSSLRQGFLVILMTLVLIGAGTRSLDRLPVDAYPDLSPPIVELITQWPGHAAEEVERLITVPVEREMNGIPQMTTIRSISLYGLSVVILTFQNGTDIYFARQQTFNRVGDVSLPSGVSPSMSPLSSPSGLIYRYVLQSADRSPMELKTFEDWVIEPQYKSVPGVADDSGFGGGTMQYQVLLDPARIASVGLSVTQVQSALAANNSNGGGGFYSQGGQFYYVRGLGRLSTPEDIGNVVLAVHDGTPVLVKDVGRVVIGIAPRLGEFGYQSQDDAVEGVILLRIGEKTQDVLKRVEAKTRELNEEILPKDVKVLPFYDRSDLVELTTQTVERNLLRGMLLVVVVLIFFLYNFRAGLIVAATIPLALFFAFICLDLQNASANLLSIGAVDFGILVDAAVVMVENIFRQIALRRGNSISVTEIIREAAAEVDRPLFYSVAVIVAGFLPIYVLAGPSGTLFKPMADTMVFALIGSLIVTLTLLPLLCAWFMRKGVQEKRNAAFERMKSVYTKGLDFCLARPWGTAIASAILLGASLLLIPRIGAEFMPHLDEGALWVRATMPYTISFEEASAFAPKIRTILSAYPQVTEVGSELGRPDDGTDATGFFNCEFYVGLKPYNDPSWQKSDFHTKKDLTAAIEANLDSYPGVIFNYTQPAEDAVDEALTGLKSALAVKIYGEDLGILEKKAVEIKNVLDRTPGFTDLTVVRELGQPSLIVEVNRLELARYGVSVTDVETVVQAAVGGQTATQVIQGEKLFDLVVRMEPQFRSNATEIGNLLVPTPSGQQIPLSALSMIKQGSGASFIYRENNSRYIGIQFSVNGRDLEGIVNAGQAAIAKNVQLPTGYRLDWGGEYSELLEAKSQVIIIGPLTVLLIFMILFALYGNFKFPVTIALGVVMTEPVGALIALKLTHTPFSVSSILGLLALMGVSVETAVILVSYINKLRLEGMGIPQATLNASLLRLRPIMMTALVACLGLLPAAMSTGVGSDTQKPFAIVVVAGLISRLVLGFFVNPVLYQMVAKEGDVLQV